MGQKDIENFNKKTFTTITENVAPKEFINYYISHTQKETCEYFGINGVRQLTKILKTFNYDFSKRKPSKFKGKSATRSHESYINGGKKSSETQKNNWAKKSKEEKDARKEKQAQAHSSEEFKTKIKQINIDYWNNLNPDRKKEINELKSISAKEYWNSLSQEEQENIKNSRLQTGKTYSSRMSGPNESFAKKLEAKNLAYEREYCINRKLFDFKVSNCLIEIDPTFTHNSTFTPFAYNKPLDKNYHKNKTDLATSQGFRCIHIFDWDDQDKIINLLSTERKSIYARKCEIKEVSKLDTINFISKYHLQGYAKSTINIGLYYGGELVSIMTFGKPRYNKKYDYELIRYCSCANITGGSQKLLKYFIKLTNCKSIVSYCDLSKFSGKTYAELGFSLVRRSAPSKHWYNPRTKKHFTDNLIRQQGFSRIINKKSAEEDNLNTADNQTLMISHGFVEVFDCGQLTYELIIKD
jgi:hypothetical protein